jgi:hypothetical protein
VKKSAAAMTSACDFRNVCHDVGRFGLGAMPSHDRVWCDDRCEPIEQPPTEWFAFRGKSSALVVSQA